MHDISVTTAVVLVVISFAAGGVLVPENALAQTTNQFPMGWYDGYRFPPSVIAAEGGNITLPYITNSTNSDVARYLDEAYDNGLKVIVDLRRNDVIAGDARAMREFVQLFDSHPAVHGWYTVDEPLVNNISISRCQNAYNVVKQVSSKPVFIAFGRREVEGNKPVTYKDTYDIALADFYPFDAGDVEFEGLEDSGWWWDPSPGFKTDVSMIAEQASEVGKPWWFVPQAFGECPTATWDHRLPTYREEKFMTYWGLLNEAEGLVYWSHYRAIQTTANPDRPYPYSGLQWIEEVWEPLADEIAICGNAIAAGALEEGLSDNKSDISCKLFFDANTGRYYIIALNRNSGSESPVFTLDLPIDAPGVVPIGEDRDLIALQNGSFSDTFASYGVHVYQVVPEPSSTLLLGTALCGLCLLWRIKSKKMPS